MPLSLQFRTALAEHDGWESTTNCGTLIRRLPLSGRDTIRSLRPRKNGPSSG
jgi:hypothetical protein